MSLFAVILVGMVSVAQTEQVGDMDGDGQVDTTEAIISLKVAAEQNPGVPLGTYIPATGNATTLDVLANKSFSNATAADLSGTLKIFDGSTIYTNSISMKFSLIPAGSFVMGSPDGSNGDGTDTHRPFWPEEDGRFDREKHHIVSLKSFYMQTTEVTQGQGEQVMGAGTNPSNFTLCGMDCPVEQVSWCDAKDFIATLSTNEGRTNCWVFDSKQTQGRV